MTHISRTMIIAAAVLGLVASNVNAASVTLESLIAGGTLTSGDKTISNVTYSAVGDMPVASEILVTPVSNGTDYGFQFSGGFIDIGGDDIVSDAFIRFTVTVDDPGMEIIGATLFGNPSVLGLGDGTAAITETFLPTITDQQLDIYDMNPGAFRGLDEVTFAEGHTSLTVQKDILLDAEAGATATLSFFDQYFVQQPVPEPASAGMLAFGFIGLLAQRRRRG